MKILLKDVIVKMVAEKPYSTRELAKIIESTSGSIFMGSSVRCCMTRLLKAGVVVRVGTDERGGAKFGLPQQAGTVTSEFNRLVAPLRQMGGV